MIPAIIAASVSLLVFLLGQWFLYRANQTAFLRTKLEEFAISLEAIIHACRYPALPEDITAAAIQTTFIRGARELGTSSLRPQMLASMYFPESDSRLKEVMGLAKEMNTWMHDYGESPGDLGVEGGQEIFVRLMRSVMHLKDYLRDEQGYLTYRISHRL